MLNMKTYSREFLLKTGMKVLGSPTARRVNFDTYSQLQKFEISSAKPTFRGRRSGKHFASKPILTNANTVSSDIKIGLLNSRSIFNN